MKNSSRFQIPLAAFFAFAGIATGALGAHALAQTLSERGMTGAWQTAAFYHLTHAIALFALGIWCQSSRPSRAQNLAGWLWTAGIFCFSGSIYILALGGPKILGPVTPIGGLLFMAGWLAIFIHALKSRPSA